MRLHLIRHPKPDVPDGVCYGASDVAVADDEQARVSSLLASALPHGVPIFSSPLRRCAVLAERLATLLGAGPVVLDDRLREINFGNWEMRSWTDIPRDDIDAWAAAPLDYRPGGGESVLQVMDRVHAFMQTLRGRHIEEAVVVCHAGTMRLLVALRDHGAPADAALAAARSEHRIGYASIIDLDLD